MASVILHTFRQINKTGEMKLFRSHNPNYRDGEQLRDFIYVKDVVNICHWLAENRPENGLYNVGTGTARPFYDLAKNDGGMLREGTPEPTDTVVLAKSKTLLLSGG